VTPGSRVKIKSGPLRGIEGYVEHREGQCLLLLRLDFIGQAAAVKIEATEVELI
jgi:transcription antitermination factor NusG